MEWLKANGWRFMVLLALLVLTITGWTEAHKDPFAPSTYEAADEAMRTLPGISCPSAPGPSADTCEWADWTMTLTPTSGTVHQLCRGRTAHVIFGGDSWSITLVPTVAGGDPPPPTGSSPAYGQLLNAFNFGNGRNWMAC